MQLKDNLKIKTYWENKILVWEFLRYSNIFLPYPASWSLRSRMFACLNYLNSINLKDKIILELGCGSGILAMHLQNRVKQYYGIDIAENAIRLANSKFELNKNFQFIANDITQLQLPVHDLSIFLGLTDWLNEQELVSLFKKIHSKDIIFSYTSPQKQNNFVYQYYRKFHDSLFAPKSYCAKSYTEEFILNLLNENGFFIYKQKSSSYFNPGNLIWAKKNE